MTATHCLRTLCAASLIARASLTVPALLTQRKKKRAFILAYFTGVGHLHLPTHAHRRITPIPLTIRVAAALRITLFNGLVLQTIWTALPAPRTIFSQFSAFASAPHAHLLSFSFLFLRVAMVHALRLRAYRWQGELFSRAWFSPRCALPSGALYAFRTHRALRAARARCGYLAHTHGAAVAAAPRGAALHGEPPAFCMNAARVCRAPLQVAHLPLQLYRAFKRGLYEKRGWTLSPFS